MLNILSIIDFILKRVIDNLNQFIKILQDILEF